MKSAKASACAINVKVMFMWASWSARPRSAPA